MALHHNPRIALEGLILALDAADTNSYPGSGTTWYDLSSLDKDFSLGGGPGLSTNGIGSLTFDGGTQFADGPALPNATTDWTIEVWFYPTSVTNYENILDFNFAYTPNSGNIGPRLEMDSAGKLVWVWSGDTTNGGAFYYSTVKGSGLSQNTWHYSALSRTSANTVLGFIDEEVTTGVSSNGTPGATFVNELSNPVLGRGFANGGSERWFSGNIAVVRAYSRALSRTELEENYEAQKTRFGL